MIDGNKNYFNHLGRYPEDDGLFFVGIDNKQCLYAELGTELTDFLYYRPRVILAKCTLVGMIILLSCVMCYCLTLGEHWWLYELVLLLVLLVVICGYFALVRYAQKLKKECTDKMLKI